MPSPPPADGGSNSLIGDPPPLTFGDALASGAIAFERA